MDVAEVLGRRLGDAARGKHLAAKYEEGVLAWARKRTAGSGAVPTTLVGERVELLLEISVALKELLTEREIAALFRLTPGTARRLSEELRSMYEDTIQPFIFRYALENARNLGPGDYQAVRGYRIAFDSEDHLTAFMTEAKRTALPVARKRGDEEHPALLYVHETFPFAEYGVSA
jgi:hypothetical protein